MQTTRRGSEGSNGSAIREFNAYHEYRQHQLQAQSEAVGTPDNTVDRNMVLPKHHNPGIEASNIIRDHLAPCELRQRVCLNKFFHHFYHLFFNQFFVKFHRRSVCPAPYEKRIQIVLVMVATIAMYGR